MNKSSIFVFVLVLFIAGCWVGVTWFNLGHQENSYNSYFEQKVIIEGYVVSDPEVYQQNQHRFEILPESIFKQKIFITTYSKDIFNYGDKIYLIGKLKQPKNTGDYDYVNYLAAKGIFAQISSSDIFITGKSKLNPLIYYSLKVKHFVYRSFQHRLPKEQAALLIALIVGQKDLMSKDVVAAFSATGTAHLIAVSGYILTLLLAFSGQASAYIGKMKTLLISLSIAMVYIVMAGFAPGVIRAAIMSGIYVLSKSFGRQYQLMPALVLTAAILVAQNPLIVKHDIGFALSFLSIVGIIYLSPILKDLLSFLPEKFLIKEIVCTTLAAQFITVPLTVYYFKELSLIAPIANLMIIPMVEPILAIGYFLCLPIIGAVVSKLVLIALNYILLVVIGLAHLPYAIIGASLTANQMVLIYIAEFCAYLLKCLSKLNIKDSYEL
jgi:competence protein ComEC